MNEETAKLLRAPFPDEVIGKLPRITCPRCRDARGRACDEHPKSRCEECANYITPRHIHLDYVGHAEVTDRLLEADPQWTWEPMALDATGLPAMDSYGGLWIRLTVSSVTRPGYGDGGGKSGADAVKETIGDALRNAAMRFGVALNLWGAHGPTEDQPPEHPAAAARAHLKAACNENGWDLGIVAGLYDGDLRTETDADAINAFREGLFARSDSELKASP